MLTITFLLGLDDCKMNDETMDSAWTRGSFVLFVGIDENEFRDAVLEASRELSHQISEIDTAETEELSGEFLAVGSSENRHSLWIRPGPKSRVFIRQIGKTLECSWIEVFFSDDRPWHYSLWNEGEQIDMFTTSPEFEGRKANFDLPSGESRADALCRCLELEKGTFERYLVEWSVLDIDDDVIEFDESRKAYENDESPYGDPFQVQDFCRGINAPSPTVEFRIEFSR